MKEGQGHAGFRSIYRHSVADGEIYQSSLIESPTLAAYIQFGDRRKPLRWTAEIEPDQFFLILNLKGSWLTRGDHGKHVNAMLPRTAVIANSGTVLDCLLSRGDHEQLIFTWPTHSTESLHRWWTEFVENDGMADDVYALTSCPSGTLMGEVFDQLVVWTRGYMPRNLPKIKGCLHLLAGEAMTQEPQYLLTAIPRSHYADSMIRLMEAVRARPSDAWTLKEAAAYAGYSPFHLSRTFKTTVGYGFPEFVERCRTERAVMRLAVKMEQSEDVAVETGFSSSQSLRDAFRDYVGILPSEIRAFGMELDLAHGDSTRD
jgi:AraC-like DNA-binding protein